jgi:hypothetical protein
MIDKALAYRTREGGAVLLHCVTAPSDCYPVVAHIETRRYGWLLAEFTEDGRYAFGDRGRQCEYDLVLAALPQRCLICGPDSACRNPVPAGVAA